MKKKKIRKIILAILIIVAIVIVISKIISGKNEQTKYLTHLYDKLNTSQTYLFEMESNDKNKTIMGKKGDKTIIDNYTENSHSTTIVKDDNTYLVLHDREEYYIYEQNNIEQTILTDGLLEIKDKQFTTGTEKVKGKKYFYEEYNCSTIFMSTSHSDISEDEIKTRFYFDNEGNLKYIKTIKGSYQELLKINIISEVEDSLFEIPANYAEN